MKKYKLLIFLIIIVLLTGCSGSYDVTLNQNLTVDEKIKIDLNNNDDVYEKARQLFINNNIDEKKYKVVQKDGKVSIIYNDSYDSIEDYILNSVLYKQLFSEIKYTKQDKEIEFNAETKLKLNSNNQMDIINDYNIDLLQINFNTDFDVYHTNSDSQYKNKYTWNLTSETTEKTINILLNPTNKEFRYKYIIIIGLILIISCIFVAIWLKKFLKTNKV